MLCSELFIWPSKLMAAKPKVYTSLPFGKCFSIHRQYWFTLLMTLSAPKHFATIPHTTLAIGYWKKRCSAVSTTLQGRQVGSPVNFLFLILSFVRVAPLSSSQRKFLILYKLTEQRIDHFLSISRRLHPLYHWNVGSALSFSEILPLLM